MWKLILILGLLGFLAPSFVAQETGTVIAIKANLRGTPSNTGIVVTTVVAGETFEVVKTDSPWYLIQTTKYVGWVHGNGIKLDDDSGTSYTRPTEQVEIKPRTTTKPLSSGQSSFQSEYIGGYKSFVLIKNQTDRILTLVFGGVTYKIPPSDEREMEIDGGRYEYSASVPRAYPTGGVEEFNSGYRYSWRFFIVRR